MKLYEDQTPEQIAKKYKLSDLVLQKILIQLEKFELIRIRAGQKVRPFYSKVPSLDGALGMAHMRGAIDRTAQFQKNMVSETMALKRRGIDVFEGGLTWNVNELSEKTYKEFLFKFRKLMDDLSEVSKHEEKTLKKSQLKMAVVNYGLFLCEPDNHNLPLVVDAMDAGLREDTPIAN